MADAYVSSASFLGIVSRKQAWSFEITSFTVSTTFCIWAAVGASALPVFFCFFSQHVYIPARSKKTQSKKRGGVMLCCVV